MEKENLINEIDQTLESIKSHINRIKNDHFQTHKLDVDMLIEKTRNLYDKLISLDALTVSFDVEISKNILQEKEEVKEELGDVVADDVQLKESPVREEIREEPILPEPEVEKEKEVTQEVLVDNTKKDGSEIVMEQANHAEQETVESEFQVKSTIDLFSISEKPTLSDKLKNDEQPTIADKITKNTINELREAIGINEKFQFINDLFNGDMNRYNKIIDELDQLPTLEGVKTYMLELKVQNQWQDDNPALIKLTDMLQRKFVK
jgi:hypothetical protein